MPGVHIWIRKDDVATWEAIENKAEWLHEHLNWEELEGPMGTVPYKQVINGGPTTKQFTHHEKATLCEHFQPKGQCMVKGCKYGKGTK